MTAIGGYWSPQVLSPVSVGFYTTYDQTSESLWRSPARSAPRWHTDYESTNLRRPARETPCRRLSGTTQSIGPAASARLQIHVHGELPRSLCLCPSDRVPGKGCHWHRELAVEQLGARWSLPIVPTLTSRPSRGSSIGVRVRHESVTGK